MFQPTVLRNREPRLADITRQSAPIREISQMQAVQSRSSTPPCDKLNTTLEKQRFKSKQDSAEKEIKHHEPQNNLNPFDADLDFESIEDPPERIIPEYIWNSFDKVERKRQQVLHGMPCFTIKWCYHLMLTLF